MYHLKRFEYIHILNISASRRYQIILNIHNIIVKNVYSVNI